MIRHLLFIQFKDDATPGQIDALGALFTAIPDKIDGVVSAEWGVNNSPEHKNRGFTHAVVMTFADEAGRQNYLPHPEHKALKAVFGPLKQNCIVVDYTVA